jgi:hypothetical protein
MSTRGLVGFVHKGEVRTTYHSSDSYLARLGQDLVDFCDLVIDWNDFIKHYEQITWDEHATQELEGVKLLQAIAKGNITTLRDEIEFADDDMFCEYAYLLNLDTKELELYSSNYQTELDQSEKHLPLNLLATYPLDDIPQNWIDEINIQKREINHDWREFYKDQGIEPDGIEL